MRFRILVVAAAACFAAGCSSSSSKAPSAAPSTSASPAAQTSGVSSSTSAPADPRMGAACDAFDTAMAATVQDIAQAAADHQMPLNFSNTVGISSGRVKLAAATAPDGIAAHEVNVAKALDALQAKLGTATSGNLDVSAEVAALTYAEYSVRDDCTAAGWTLKNMIMPS